MAPTHPHSQATTSGGMSANVLSDICWTMSAQNSIVLRCCWAMLRIWYLCSPPKPSCQMDFRCTLGGWAQARKGSPSAVRWCAIWRYGVHGAVGRTDSPCKPCRFHFQSTRAWNAQARCRQFRRVRRGSGPSAGSWQRARRTGLGPGGCTRGRWGKARRARREGPKGVLQCQHRLGTLQDHGTCTAAVGDDDGFA